MSAPDVEGLWEGINGIICVQLIFLHLLSNNTNLYYSLQSVNFDSVPHTLLFDLGISL